MRPLLIINSGDRRHASRGQLQRFEKILAVRLEHYRVTLSRSCDETAGLIMDARRNGFDTVIAGGGDGTLNVVLNFLPLDELALGVLPLGTVNCFAKSIGLANNPDRALEQLLAGAPRRISLGTINDRRFLCFCSIGFDAAVVHECDRGLKRLIRAGAFVFSGLKVFATQRNVRPFRLNGDLQLDPLHSLMISQIPVYGGFRLFPRAHPADGRLHACALLNRSRIDLLRMLLRWRRYARDPAAAPPSIRFLQFATLHVHAELPLCVQIDGEPIELQNPRSLEIASHPQAVHCLFP